MDEASRPGVDHVFEVIRDETGELHIDPAAAGAVAAEQQELSVECQAMCIIMNELLCSVNHLLQQAVDPPDIVDFCCRFYTVPEIEGAKNVLLRLLEDASLVLLLPDKQPLDPAQELLIKQQTLEEVVQILSEMGNHYPMEMPSFVALDLSRIVLPPTSADTPLVPAAPTRGAKQAVSEGGDMAVVAEPAAGKAPTQMVVTTQVDTTTEYKPGDTVKVSDNVRGTVLSCRATRDHNMEISLLVPEGIELPQDLNMALANPRVREASVQTLPIGIVDVKPTETRASPLHPPARNPDGSYVITKRKRGRPRKTEEQKAAEFAAKQQLKDEKVQRRVETKERGKIYGTLSAERRKHAMSRDPRLLESPLPGKRVPKPRVDPDFVSLEDLAEKERRRLGQPKKLNIGGMEVLIMPPSQIKKEQEDEGEHIVVTDEPAAAGAEPGAVVVAGHQDMDIGEPHHVEVMAVEGGGEEGPEDPEQEEEGAEESEQEQDLDVKGYTVELDEDLRKALLEDEAEGREGDRRPGRRKPSLASSLHNPRGRYRKKNGEQREYRCSQCGKTFNYFYQLKYHIRIHTGEKPFECSECGQKFRQQTSLRIHQQIHLGIRAFSCSYCPKTFTQHSTWRQHERTHTGEKPFVCDTCGRRFARTSALHDHKRTHTGERPHRCKHCGRSFRRLYLLKVHERIHTGDKPLKCLVCGQQFSNPGSFYKHRKGHQDMIQRQQAALARFDTSGQEMLLRAQNRQELVTSGGHSMQYIVLDPGDLQGQYQVMYEGETVQIAYEDGTPLGTLAQMEGGEGGFVEAISVEGVAPGSVMEGVNVVEGLSVVEGVPGVVIEGDQSSVTLVPHVTDPQTLESLPGMPE